MDELLKKMMHDMADAVNRQIVDVSKETGRLLSEADQKYAQGITQGFIIVLQLMIITMKQEGVWTNAMSEKFSWMIDEFIKSSPELNELSIHILQSMKDYIDARTETPSH